MAEAHGVRRVVTIAWANTHLLIDNETTYMNFLDSLAGNRFNTDFPEIWDVIKVATRSTVFKFRATRVPSHMTSKQVDAGEIPFLYYELNKSVDMMARVEARTALKRIPKRVRDAAEFRLRLAPTIQALMLTIGEARTKTLPKRQIGFTDVELRRMSPTPPKINIYGRGDGEEAEVGDGLGALDDEHNTVEQNSIHLEQIGANVQEFAEEFDDPFGHGFGLDGAE